MQILFNSYETKMKTLAFIILLVLSGSSGYLVKVPKSTLHAATGVNGWIHRQKLILPFFDNVCEVSIDPVINKLAEEFTNSITVEGFLKPEVISNFHKLRTGKGFLRRGEIFTETDIDHFNELKTILDIFVYAKDFDTFYKAAAWARQNLNCGLFVNAIYIAIENRRDTEKLSVPGPYELLPNYFINRDVILKASSILTGDDLTKAEFVRDLGTYFTLDANYTRNEAYFLEDVGLNTYYYMSRLNLRLGFINTGTTMISKADPRYGEYVYNKMKLMLTRYNLERYSNGLFEVEGINWDSLIEDSYDPMLIYSNGGEFSKRSQTLDVPNNGVIAFLKNIEAQIATYKIQPFKSKTIILNELMDILVTGDQNYKDEACKLLGKDVSINNSLPSAMEHYITSIRDPMFWRISQKIVDLVDDVLSVLPGYTKSELYFPGVQVVNIDVKKMMTLFDKYEFDVTDALKTTSTNTTFQVKINQYRLTSKPFTLKLNISSLVNQKGLVKIYLGPKRLPGQIDLKNSFMLLDSFNYFIKTGNNIITRTSEEMNLSGDFTSYRSLIQKVEDSEFGLDALPIKNIQSILGYPSRLILPKGSSSGLSCQLFVFVAPYVKATVKNIYSDSNIAVQSPGYPLDLNIEPAKLFSLPNAFVKDVIITHKGNKVPNFVLPGSTTSNFYETSRGGSGFVNNNDRESSEFMAEEGQYRYKNSFSSGPDSSKYQYNKESFDYNSKKGQYGNKGNFGTSGSNYPQQAPPLKFNHNITDELTVLPMSSDLVIEDEVKGGDFQSDDPYFVEVEVHPIHESSSSEELLKEKKTKPLKVKFDYKKHKFDYKANKKEIEKEKYEAKKNRNLKKYKDDVETDSSDSDSNEIIHDSYVNSNEAMHPIIKTHTNPRRRPTVFAYLLHNLFIDDSRSDENVYEL